ncbi:hypothetical protein CROQUDRAFT_721912 [Cronartium quercuum f. sp. fusiforme G11]|uniref:Uncharacterized protein n=1 Tax=Cronartium quercuum f. sp. fusiforme G11 TaxID=708437 RepID=A0A9P6NPQ0_9BASI|nr:hypothetical protein CROQUDRAFT_721912 [Cronartium quercuum f. sp. fusiforme G11]
MKSESGKNNQPSGHFLITGFKPNRMYYVNWQEPNFGPVWIKCRLESLQQPFVQSFSNWLFTTPIPMMVHHLHYGVVMC